MRSSKAVLSLATLALATFGLAACGDDDGGGETTKPTEAATVGAPGAKVEFLAPKDGTTTGSTVNAKVKLTNFTIDPAAVGKAAKEGEGHLHFSLDEGKYDYPKYSGANGQLAKKLGVEGQYSPSTTPTITYKDLPGGEHTLEVYLANNDHTDTGVVGTTTFAVKQVP